MCNSMLIYKFKREKVAKEIAEKKGDVYRTSICNVIEKTDMEKLNKGISYISAGDVAAIEVTLNRMKEFSNDDYCSWKDIIKEYWQLAYYNDLMFRSYTDFDLYGLTQFLFKFIQNGECLDKEKLNRLIGVVYTGELEKLVEKWKHYFSPEQLETALQNQKNKVKEFDIVDTYICNKTDVVYYIPNFDKTPNIISNLIDLTATENLFYKKGEYVILLEDVAVKSDVMPKIVSNIIINVIYNEMIRDFWFNNIDDTSIKILSNILLQLRVYEKDYENYIDEIFELWNILHWELKYIERYMEPDKNKYLSRKPKRKNGVIY